MNKIIYLPQIKTNRVKMTYKRQQRDKSIIYKPYYLMFSKLFIFRQDCFAILKNKRTDCE